MVYLDWAASAPPDFEILEQMARNASKYFGNPSSFHNAGKAAKAALDAARLDCARVLNCDAGQLAFTSSGTESNAIVLLSLLGASGTASLLISGIEHASVSQPATVLSNLGWNLKELEPNSDGRLDAEKLAKALEEGTETRLVAIMAVNNETGAIQPLEELVAVVRSASPSSRRRVHFHADFVQAVGKISINLSALDIDSASFSAHKFQGPRGVGLLYHRNPNFQSMIRGGGQEHGVRPGTENVAGAIALASALEKHGQPSRSVKENGAWLLSQLADNCTPARIVPENRTSSPNNSANYTPGIVTVGFPPIPGEVLARVLANKGFVVSTGSACRGNRNRKASKIFGGLPLTKEILNSAIRVSFGPSTTRGQLEEFFETLKTEVRALLKRI